MAFEDLDTNNELEPEDTALPEESNNRPFLIIAGVLGALAVLALICIGIYALVIVPRNQSQKAQQEATVNAQKTEVEAIIVQTSTAAAIAAIEAAYTPTPTNTPVRPPDSPTPLVTNTPVVALATTAVPLTPTMRPEMATATVLHATLTANAIIFASTQTAKPLTTQAIPDTGFADDVGLPLLLGLAILLIVVIFIARRLRTA
jgi:hypothetical protein